MSSALPFSGKLLPLAEGSHLAEDGNGGVSVCVKGMVMGGARCRTSGGIEGGGRGRGKL